MNVTTVARYDEESLDGIIDHRLKRISHRRAPHADEVSQMQMRLAADEVSDEAS